MNQGLQNRRQHEQETTRRSIPRREVADHSGRHQEWDVSETCRRHSIAPSLFYRWKDEAEQGAKVALGGRSAAATETEKGSPHPAVGENAGAQVAGDRNPKK